MNFLKKNRKPSLIAGSNESTFVPYEAKCHSRNQCAKKEQFIIVNESRAKQVWKRNIEYAEITKEPKGDLIPMFNNQMFYRSS